LRVDVPATPAEYQPSDERKIFSILKNQTGGLDLFGLKGVGMDICLHNENGYTF
jgi:hypothetical protein